MRQNNLNAIIKISLLSVMAFVLMFMEVGVPIFPAFLKIDLSDLPALLGSFALGPVAGIIIELFKNVLILMFKGTQTGFVGEIANFIVGSLLVGTAGIIYKLNKSRKTAIIGLIAGTVVMSVVASVLNYTVLLPLYGKLYKMPVDVFVAMGTAINPAIKDMKDFILWSILPFNLFKGIVVSAITIPVYKRVSPILHKKDVAGESKRNAFEN